MILLPAAVAFLLPAAPAETPALPLKAQYDWGYVGADGEGKGVLSVAIDPATAKLVLELHGLGERLVLLQGNGQDGYRIQIPRQKLDRTVKSLDKLPVPFLPKLGSVEAVLKLFEQGQGPGVKADAKDAQGPRKLRYQGQDEQGNDVMVWLTRTRWERG